jgi:hypothetical protein
MKSRMFSQVHAGRQILRVEAGSHPPDHRVPPSEKDHGSINFASKTAPVASTLPLSVITGGGKWVEIAVPADSLYQHLLFTAEKKFWRCVESGEPPRLFGIETPLPRIEAVRVVDMSSSNAWAEFATQFRENRAAFLKHENAKAELKSLMPEDAREAIGHGVRARRSKSGPVSVEFIESETDYAAL